jgi:hypothetical protein
LTTIKFPGDSLRIDKQSQILGPGNYYPANTQCA